jgi:S-adenosylmethionine:tRNA ribosyltransferase-isomerase
LISLAEFDYTLPEELIAQRPLEHREDSRMLVLYREEQRWEDRLFIEFPRFLRPGDCLVLNNSKVIPSRLYGHRAGTRSLPIGKHNPKRWQYLTGQVEVLLLHPVSADRRDWKALVRPGRKMRIGEVVLFGDNLKAEILERGELGERTLRFFNDGDVDGELERIGHMPLPPYIKRPDEPADRERYQTVFAKEKGSVAAPTAGLHFTPAILEQCGRAGAEIAYVTLHVGLGTFQPIHTEQITEHRLHAEHYEITPENEARIRAAARRVAVGTTSVRTLESAALRGPRGDTDLFIFPGFDFQLTGAMLTNFHLPRTSLLLLVCAFAGKDFVLAAYRHAVEQRYRFYSYGDCMLII